MNLFGANNQHRISACKNADDLRNHNAEFSVYPVIADKFAFDVLVLFLVDFLWYDYYFC